MKQLQILCLNLLVFFFSGLQPAFTQATPYYIPEIKTEDDFQNIVYIDPTSKRGDGSYEFPYNSLADIKPEPNTAYLIKRGTVLQEHISEKWNHNLIGAYGTGPKPIISQGLVIQGGSKDLTLYGLEIQKPGIGGHDMVLSFHHQPTSYNITIAFCRLIGTDTGRGYPLYVIEHGAEGLVFYNNEVAYCRNNGWWLNARDVMIIRNWFHNINKDGETSTESTGDIIQSIYYLQDAYIAGNLFDKRNSMWKYTLMLNVQEHGRNITVEYNTFYAPKQGAGGAAIRWTPGENASFRKNLIFSVDEKGENLVVPFDTWEPIANQPEPFGIRDNHIVADTGDHVVAYGKAKLHNSNLVFKSMTQYKKFLAENPELGQYGSDIDPLTF